MISASILVSLIFTTLSHAAIRQNLGSSEWGLTGSDAMLIVNNVTVPGGVFTDLMRSGEIGDIFYGTGDSNYSWVSQSDWTYSSTFTVEQELLDYLSVQLIFEGLDTFATIAVNGQEVGRSENMFVRYKFDVKDVLKVGDNEITVQFTSAVNQAAALAENPENEYVVPPECPDAAYRGICHVNRIRKMQSSFSWDWGPAFASMGIWKDVYLLAFNNAAIDYVFAKPVLNPEFNTWSLSVYTYYNGGIMDEVSGTLTLTLHMGFGEIISTHPVLQFPLENFEIYTVHELDLPQSFELWWPNGYGPQTLYNLTAHFQGDIFGDEYDDSDETTVRIGFRTVELVQEELEQGLSFYFKVNGQPIFAKGANQIPIDIIPEKGQDRETIRRVLQTARDTHMNMIRVWGGGIYESDYFYDLADEYGILIWQDFMFACAMYPSDEAFLNNVLGEVRHQTKRLAHHPSIALWSGSNENEAALAQDWYGTADNFATYKADYIQLYVDTIQPEVSRILGNVTYITSSPTNGLETIEEGYVANNPGDPLYGDVHFYDYSSDSWDVTTFPIPRFASEYGYQSMPTFEAWMTVTDTPADLDPEGEFLDYRQHHPDGNAQNLNLIQLQLQLPDPSHENYINAFIYFSQIVQAQSVKAQTEHYRSFKGRLDSNQQGNTMGALYWQLNDVWVAPTWSGMDYTGRWKMLQYFALDFFNPLVVTGRLVSEELEIYAIYDQFEVPEDVTTTVLLHIYNWNSLTPLVSVEFPITLDPQQAVLATTINAPTALNLAGCGDDYAVARKNCFFHLHIIDQNGNHLAPFNYIFPEKLKDSNLSDATIEIIAIVSTNADFTEYEITLQTNAVTLFVWLDSHDVRGRFSENGFLQVTETKTVTFTAEEPIDVSDLYETVTLTHLRDAAYY